MAESYEWRDSDADRRFEEAAQRYEGRLAEAERAQANAHRIQTRGIGRVRNWLLAVFTGAVVVGVMVAVYILASGASTEEPPFLQCETPDSCPAPIE